MEAFYKIEDSLEFGLIGNWPQIEEAIYNCNPLEDPRFIDNIGHHQIDFIPKTPIGILNSKAKLTDFLSSPAMGFTRKLIISNRVKEVLEAHNIPDIQLFECQINVGNKSEVYWILNPTNFKLEYVDYEKSEIYLMKSSFQEIEKLNIFSAKELHEQEEKIMEMGSPYRLRINKLILKEIDAAFFALNKVRGGINYFISETMKREFQNRNITGIAFKSIN